MASLFPPTATTFIPSPRPPPPPQQPSLPIPQFFPPNDPSAVIRHGINRIPSPGPTNTPMSSAQLQLSKRMEAYQRDRLGMFTINELQDAGCWDKSDAKACNLEGGIHTLFERRRGGFKLPGDERADIGKGVPGKWEMGNERVWEVMQPILRLATRLISNVWLWPWLDALFDGKWDYIDESLMPDEPDHAVFGLIGAASFRTRSIQQIISGKPMQDSIAQHLSQLAPYFAIGFAAHKDKGPLPGNVLGAYHTVMNGPAPDYKYRANCIYLSTWTIEPLLVMEMTESEKLVQQFAVAKTLLHETMHACGWFAKNRRPDLKFWTPEPFFEDEAMCELGRSWEVSIFGGLTQALFFDPLLFGKSPSWASPLCAITSSTWPNFSAYGDGKHKPHGALTRYRFPEKFGIGSIREMWPIQIQLLENMQQEDFWRVHVAAMGADCIKYPKIFGRRDCKGINTEMIYGVDYDRWVGPKYQYMPAPEVWDNATARQRWEIEEARRVRKNAIAIAIRKDRKEKKVAKAKHTERIRLFRVQQVATLDTALRCYDLDVFTESLAIYSGLKTPFPAIAIQRNLAMYCLLQACHGGDRGTRDRWLGAVEMLRLEKIAKTTNIESQKADFKVLLNRVFEIFIKDKTMSPVMRNKNEQERREAVMTVIRTIAALSVDHIAPKPSDMGGIDKNAHYPIPDAEVEKKRKLEETVNAVIMGTAPKRSRSGDGKAVPRADDDAMEGLVMNGDVIEVEPVGIFTRVWRAFF